MKIHSQLKVYWMGNSSWIFQATSLVAQSLMVSPTLQPGFVTLSSPEKSDIQMNHIKLVIYAMDIPWNPHVSTFKSQVFMVKSPFFHALTQHFTMVFPWFSHDFLFFPMIFPWFSHGFPILAIVRTQPASGKAGHWSHSASKSWGRRRPVISDRCTWDISSWTTLGRMDGFYGGFMMVYDGFYDGLWCLMMDCMMGFMMGFIMVNGG